MGERGGGRGDILAAARLKANFFLYDAIFAVNFCRAGFFNILEKLVQTCNIQPPKN